MFAVLFVIFFATIASESNACTDLTRTPDAYGREVVMACMQLIEKSGVFSNDHNLMSKIAWVESQYGENAFTYVPESSFHGGIWGINEGSFNATKTSGLISSINESFQIDWKLVVWKDLRKPLYSALAARIYLDVAKEGFLLNSTEDQLALWRLLNGGRRRDSDFTNAVFNDTENDFFEDFEKISIGKDIQREIGSSIFLQTNVANIEEVELEFRVISGNATLYVSNSVSTSSSVHCGTTNEGRIFMKPAQLFPYELNDSLYMYVDGTSGSIFQLTVSISKRQPVYENVTFGSESSKFVIGMYSNHPDTGSLPITLLVTSNENEAFELFIENITGSLMNVTINATQTEILLPHMYVVSDENETEKGIFLRTNEERKIGVSVINSSPTMHSTDSYHALPVIKYAGLDEYVYYGITPNTNVTGLKNRLLLIGNYDHTSVTITPTQQVTIKNKVITANEAHTIELNGLETLLIQSQQPLTGTKVVSNKPITFLSGHQCAVVPEFGNSCDFAIEQIPPTVTWGKRFMFQMLSSRTGGSHFTVLTSENSTNASLWCTLPSTNQSLQSNFTLEEAGDFKMLEIAPDDVICSLSTNKPSALVLFGTSQNADEGNGDPLLMMIPPVEQFSSTFMYKSRENFNATYIHVMVMGNQNNVLKDDVPFSSTWNEIKEPNGIDTLGFATKLLVQDFNMHTITTGDTNTNISVLMYGLDFSVGYGQRVSTMLKPISSPFEYNVQPTISETTTSQQLTCLTGGIPAYAFTWERDGHGLISPSYKYSIASSGYTDNVLTITQPTSEDSGVYTCTFYTYYDGFESTSIDTTLNVIALPQPPAPMLISLKDEYGNVEAESTRIEAYLTNGMLIKSASWRFEDLNGTIMDISNEMDKYIVSGDELSLEVWNLGFSDRGIIALAIRTKDGTAELKVMLKVYVVVALLNITQEDYHVNIGDSITFNCTGDGINAPVFHWTKDQELLLGSAKYIIHSINDIDIGNIQGIKRTNTSLTITAVDSNDRALYACVANNEAQEASTKQFNLTVAVTEIDNCSPDPCSNGKCENFQEGFLCICEEGYTGKNCDKVVQVFIPPSIITPPSDLKVDLYDQGHLVCASSGVPTPTTKWYKDGEPITNTNIDQSKLVFSSTDLDNRGIYYCEVNSTDNGRTYTAKSEPVIVNINNVVQYEGYLEINSSFVDISSLIEEINYELLGTQVNGSSFFVLQEIKGEKFENQQIPVLLTMLTTETQVDTRALLDAIRSQILTRIPQSLDIIDFIVDPGDRFDGCQANSTILNANITIDWAETNIGDTAYTICPCGNISSETNLYATRYCGGNFKLGGTWEAGDIAVCNFSSLTRELCQLAQFKVPKRLQRLDNLTNATLDSTEVTVSVLILIGTTKTVVGNESLTDIFLTVVDNILFTDQPTMLLSTRMSNTSARLQEAILLVADKLPLPNDTNSLTLIRSKFAVSVQRIDFSNFNGINYSVNATDNLSDYGVQYENVANSTSSITLPSNLFGDLISSNRSRISNSVFLNNNAFLVEDIGSYDVGGLIMSARVVGIDHDDYFKNLTPPVSMRFESLVNGTNPICVFFDTKANNGSGKWSRDGCYSVRSQNGSIIECYCNHLTSFTILLDVSPTAQENAYSHSGHALTAITYIGLCISIVCLIVTIISYLSIKRLRNSETGKLLINLCIALIGLYITFIAAVHSKDSIGMCSFVGAVLHYFFLVTFLAMAIQAVDLYIKLVIVLGRRINYFVIKGVIVCWVAPLPLVVLSFVPNYKNYASEHFCRAFGVPYYVGMITPFLVIYLFNWTVFVLTFVSITRQALRKRKVEENTQQFNLAFIKREFISAILLSSLLGVGWGIGLLASNDIHSNAASRDAVSAIFVLLTAFHGVLIFVMHSIRSKDIRLLWKKGFFMVTRKEFTPSTTGTFESSRKRNQQKKKGLELYSKNMESRTVETSHTYDTIDDPADATLRYHVINHQAKVETEFLSDFGETINEEKVDLSAIPNEYEMPVEFIYDKVDDDDEKSGKKETP